MEVAGIVFEPADEEQRTGNDPHTRARLVVDATSLETAPLTAMLYSSNDAHAQ